MNIYIAVSALLIVTSALVFALIFMTPLRRLVPGYANVYESREYRELNNQVRALEQEMVDQRLYLERFRSLLAGVPMPDSAVTPKDEALISSAISGPFQPFTPIASQPPEPRITLNPGNERFGTQFLSVVPPIRGIVSASYNPNSAHLGTDILAPENTPVVAILDGTVLFADWTLEAGNTIGIQHEGNMVSVYKHNSRNLKKEGARVKAGEAVAIIGNTGEATTGPHLHFELWIDGRSVDPQLFVNF
jgi:murein DD-endopeptidase MepM/ murein hydrolase activator NlpD